jgi:hypothetical protein
VAPGASSHGGGFRARPRSPTLIAIAARTAAAASVKTLPV